jgi:signal transduction histidine kinase
VRGGLTFRTVVASTVLAVTVGASFAFSLVAISAARDWERQVTGSLEELAVLNNLERLVIDLETGVRGFVITHEDRFLQPWDDARAAFPDRADDLLRLTDDPVQDPLARQIAADVESYIQDYAAPLVEAARRGDPAASSVSTTEEGKQRIDEIRAAFDRYRAAESTPLARRLDRSNDAARRAIFAAAAGLVGSLLLIALVAGYSLRAVVAPLRRAAGMAGRLAGGDLSARLPESATGEIGSLDRSFNSMARSLEANRDDLTRLLAEQAALRRVATLVARRVVPAEIFSAVGEEISQLIGAHTAGVARFEPDGAATVVAALGQDVDAMPVGRRWEADDGMTTTAVWRTGRAARADEDDFDRAPAAIAEERRRWGVRSVVASPIIVEGHRWGAMIVSTQGDPFPPDTEDRMANFTELVATAIANADSRAELKASRARVVAAGDEARRRIERDLHDGTQQRLVSVGLELRAAQAMVPPDVPDLTAQLSHVAEDLAAAVTDLQEASRGIHPAVLSRGGLGPALRTLARRSALPVELDLRVDRRLPERIEVAAYYVVSEALTNAAKHAHASVVEVELEADDDTVRLSIRDDGVGGADPTRGSGLVGLRDRIEALGGKIQVASPAGSGTSVVVQIPIDEA